MRRALYLYFVIILLTVYIAFTWFGEYNKVKHSKDVHHHSNDTIPSSWLDTENAKKMELVSEKTNSDSNHTGATSQPQEQNSMTPWNVSIPNEIKKEMPFTDLIASMNASQPPKVCSKPVFVTRLQSFPFDQLASVWSVASKKKERDYLVQSLSDIALDGVLEEPPVSVNESCRVPRLLSPTKINCRKYPEAFTGRKNASPARIAHLIQFGFDVDTLEIHLYEIYDVVDYIFLIESTSTHRGTPKPLLWETLKRIPRFSKFQNKVIHFVLDEAYIPRNQQPDRKNLFKLESAQEEMRWTRFLEWNKRNNYYFRDTDIVGFGDVDEIPSRHNLHLLKHCQLRSGQVDIGIWFPMGLIDQAFRTDYPVSGHPYTLGDPTFWTLAKAKRHRPFPNRQRGQSMDYLVGGAHFSNYLYAPHLILKHMTASEYDISAFSSLFKAMKEGDMKTVVEQLKSNIPDRIRRLKSFGKSAHEFVYLPWFYDCNRDRYPSWERGRFDLRVFSECDIEAIEAKEKEALKQRRKRKARRKNRRPFRRPIIRRPIFDKDFY